MAKVAKNLILHGASGKIGDQIVSISQKVVEFVEFVGFVELVGFVGLKDDN